MFALRSGLARAASGMAGAQPAQQLRTFASGHKKRLTWRQKAKI
ncbi:hypothetical protein PC110_g22507, partial [Phytophthora cactorum]